LKGIEVLNIVFIQTNHKLAKAITDVAWSEFMRQLEYNGQWKGKTVLKGS